MRALVLEGGAMRGVFTAGILDSLAEHGLGRSFDCILGVSAGACCASSFLAQQQKRDYLVYREFMTTKDFANPLRLLRGGTLVDMNFVVGPVARKLYPVDVETLKRSPCRFEAVATHALSGKPAYLPANQDDCFDAIHASISMPIFYKQAPILFRGDLYFDGALVDPIPVDRAIELGADDITVVLTRPRSYTPKPNSRFSRFVVRKALAKYPKIVDLIETYHLTSKKARKFLEQPPSEIRKLRVYIPPEHFPVQRLTRDKMKLHQGYMMGREVYQKGGLEMI